jgi:hypothetical protein
MQKNKVLAAISMAILIAVGIGGITSNFASMNKGVMKNDMYLLCQIYMKMKS